MLVVAGTITIDPAKRDTAMAAFEKMRAATLQEPGCLEYQAYFDRAERAIFFLFEKWQSEEALAGHFGTPHMAEFAGAMRDFGVRSADVRKYTVADEIKVM